MDPVFFTPTRSFTAGEISTLTGAVLADQSRINVSVRSIAAAASGGADDLVFVDGRKNAGLLSETRAGIALVSPELVDVVPAGTVALATKYPQLAFAIVGRLLFPTAAIPESVTGETGVSARAFIADSAQIEDGAIIEAGAVIGAGAAVGAGTVVAPNAVIGQNVQIGRNGFVGPNTTIQYALVGDRCIIHAGAQIGQDGFGFTAGPKGPERLPQIGRVIIQDNVEIGANTTVDRGALTDTVIGDGTKIDNLVQIAHNVKIGRGCIIAGHCGISGSCTLGDFVMLGGRVGLKDHLTIGSGAQIAAAAGVMDDIPAGERWAGAPAVPMRDFFRQVSAIRGLAAARKAGKE